MPSNKNFAYSFSFIFFVFSILFFYFRNNLFFYIFFSLSFLFLLTGKIYPNIFKYPNYLWTQLAELLNKIVSPVVLMFLFYFIFTPFGLIAKLFSKSLKNLSGKYNGNVKTNFVDYKNKTNYKNQF